MLYSDVYTKKKSARFYLLMLGVSLLIGLGSFIGLAIWKTYYYQESHTARIKNLEVVNLSNKGASIYWYTDEPKTGWVVYGTKPTQISHLVFDAREAGQDEQKGRGTSHHHLVTLSDLEPDTRYYYKIVSGGTIVQAGNNPFGFVTPAGVDVKELDSVAKGVVTYSDGQPAEGTLVFLRLQDSYRLVTTVNSSGEWQIPLDYVVETSKNTTSSISKTEGVTLDMVNEEGLRSSINTLVNRITPLSQAVTLGHRYKLEQESEVLAVATPEARIESRVIGITFPKEEAIIPGSKPLVKGYALPVHEVLVSIDTSPPRDYRVVSDKEGIWHLEDIDPMDIGSYTLTMQTINANNQPVQRIRQFAIAPVGLNILGEATEEAEPTAEQEPNPAISPSIAPSPRPRPTSPPSSRERIPQQPVAVLTPQQNEPATPQPIGPRTTSIPIQEPRFIPTNQPRSDSGIVPQQGGGTSQQPPVSGDNYIPIVIMGVLFTLVGVSIVLAF